VSVTRAQGLLRWADAWRNLRAWRRDLSLVEVVISDRAHPRRLGSCWDFQQRLVVYRGDSFAEELATVLHELAHAACIGGEHGEQWQATYAAAVTEVTGLPVVTCAEDYQVLCMSARDAVKAWWVSSGNDFAWRLVHRV
jgi:hypothetical protein